MVMFTYHTGRVFISAHTAHGAQGINATICMDIALREHSSESPSHPQWKANFNQGWEGNVSMPPGITGAGGYRVVQHLRKALTAC